MNPESRQNRYTPSVVPLSMAETASPMAATSVGQTKAVPNPSIDIVATHTGKESRDAVAGSLGHYG